jgi:outer membrane receptor protein involved in Fe transport
MKKTGDIVGVINSENDRISLNAGESTHKGIELGLQAGIYQDILLSTSFSYSEQTYGQFEYLYNCFKCSPPVFNQVLNFNGNEVGKAPKTLGNIAVRYEPMRINGFMVELELEHVGKYYTDETNTNEYNGHDLLNLRSRYQINSQFEIYGRLQNLTDKRYSTYTSNQVGSTDIDYRPGLPLTLYAGLRLNF